MRLTPIKILPLWKQNQNYYIVPKTALLMVISFIKMAYIICFIKEIPKMQTEKKSKMELNKQQVKNF